jgi:hypothetical protein
VTGASPDTQLSGDALMRSGGRGLLLTLYAALRSLKLYPVENATVQKSLDDLGASAQHLLAVESPLEIRLAGDFIFVNQTRLRLELDNYASFSHMLTLFRGFDIGLLRVHPGVDRREWQAFLSILLSLSAKGMDDELFDELHERLAAADVGHLDVERATVAPETLDDIERQREVAKRTYAQGVAVTRDAAHRGSGAQQRDLAGRAHHHPRL